MKKHYIFLVSLMSFLSLTAQTVTIPNANFKAYLVGNSAINTNMDTEIQVSEATAFTGTIDCNILSINDLTGIEVFTSLTNLVCSNNQLTSLDLSSNTSLTNVTCFNNQLTTLNVTGLTVLSGLACQSNMLSSISVSSNTSLTNLNVGANNLTTIDVSSNPSLLTLNCSNNGITSLNISANPNLLTLNVGGCAISNLNLNSNTALVNLLCEWNNLSSLNLSNNINLMTLRCYNNTNITTLDLSANVALTVVDCADNLLTSFNMANGNNTNITTFDVTGTSLTCITVDDAAFSTANWTNIPVGASFSENCLAGLSENEVIQLDVFPNPASTKINLEISQPTRVEITTTSGQIIRELEVNGNSTIEVSTFTTGIYFIKTSEGQTVKFIKE